MRQRERARLRSSSGGWRIVRVEDFDAPNAGFGIRRRRGDQIEIFFVVVEGKDLSVPYSFSRCDCHSHLNTSSRELAFSLPFTVTFWKEILPLVIHTTSWLLGLVLQSFAFPVKHDPFTGN